MLKSLSLTFFRKHEDLTVDFTTGLNVLRGANESGKSTLIEAALYAWFGAKALRNSLADTVTWGHKEAELKVELVCVFNDTTYKFVRHKGGASCSYDPGNGYAGGVTGHEAVTSYAAELLGADAKTASVLMLASQSGLRGAIDDGPAAVSGLMAKLADFDMLDKIVARAEERLLTGSPNYINAQIENLKAEKTKAEASIPDEGVVEVLTEMRDAAQVKYAAALHTFTNSVRPRLNRAQEALYEVQHKHEWHQSLKRRYSDVGDRLGALDYDIKKAQAIVDNQPSPEAIAEAEARVAAVANQKHLRDIYNELSTLGSGPDVVWDKDEADFTAALQELQRKDAECSRQSGIAHAAAVATRRELITNGKCPTCGHGARSDEHVAEHNAAVEARALVHDEARHGWDMTRVALASELSLMVKLQKSAKVWLDFAAKVTPDLPISIDRSVYPPAIKWTTDVPGTVDLTAARQTLNDLRNARDAAAQQQGRIDVFREQVAKLGAEALVLKDEIEDTVLPDIEAARAEVREANDSHTQMSALLEQLMAQVADAVRKVDDAIRNRAAAVERADALSAQLEKAYTDLQELNTNNALLSKLKKLKPAITDHLWNQVLAAVSTFFTTLRGEASIVSKGSSGFKINDKGVDSYSGSTIDVLALAVRVALTKTFIPHASFMVLDEPAHGCDTARTSNVLGFLSSVGFQQTLLASHDELSESVADNVIALGA